ncbi:helix-turn-helix domain-containing protein [Nitrosospira sp. Is2]|uniref:helix-turn-helix domain-containing protein n=1 Tax=Nitrosospira sp. Is2 TaxID=3080532 RepID=UPI002953B94E|nr:helix-turn-helix domain-containing protein [Nitrosospira sp. Is2]WON72496.1 helix-turn-helix domain-containing protein [Nitrosospira sp. Is2]
MDKQNTVKHHSFDPLLSTPEAAAYLGVTEGTISVWRCTRRYPIPYIKIGRLVKYRKSALDAFLAQRTVGVSTIHEGGLS